MQRKDMERLAQQADALLEIDAKGALIPHGVGGLARSVISQQTAALRALLAERDAAFAAGQEDMRERAAEIAQEKHDLALKFLSQYLKDYAGQTDSLLIASEIRALPIKDSPDGR